MFVPVFSQHVAMVFPPGRVVYFHDDGLYFFIRFIITVKKTGRVKTMTKVPQVGQKANRAVRPFPGFLFHKVPYLMIQRLLRVPEMVFPPEISQIKFFIRPERVKIEQMIQSVEESKLRFAEMKQKIIAQGKKKKAETVSSGRLQSEMMLEEAKRKLTTRSFRPKISLRRNWWTSLLNWRPKDFPEK